MATTYDIRYATHHRDAKHYDTNRLRQEYLVDKLMQDDHIHLVYSHYDRVIVGGIVPIKQTLELETIPPLKADYFCQRREVGIINIGQVGSIIVDGETYVLDYKEALYIGRGAKSIKLSSADVNEPARFYLLSAPAHTGYPNKKVGQSDGKLAEMGSLEESNARKINKLIVNGVVETCQLQMGMTELQSGSVWNTMPCHLHDRRMEVYFYFEVPKDQAVCHFMGQPQESRHIWVHNQQAVLSPTWSIHSAAGTSNYIFIWGMAGENLDYGDMDFYKATDLK